MANRASSSRQPRQPESRRPSILDELPYIRKPLTIQPNGQGEDCVLLTSKEFERLLDDMEALVAIVKSAVEDWSRQPSKPFNEFVEDLKDEGLLSRDWLASKTS